MTKPKEGTKRIKCVCGGGGLTALGDGECQSREPIAATRCFMRLRALRFCIVSDNESRQP